MKLQRREKILAGSALGLLVLVGLWFLFFAGDSRSAEQLIAEESKLTNEIESKQKQVQAAGRDAKRFAEWQRRALPPDPVLARSLYQNWIGGLAAKVNFHAYTLQATEVGARHDEGTRISFTLRGRAKLGDLVEFLYEFYKAGFLHQICKLDAKPIQNSRDLDVNLSIEALSLPAAESKHRLPQEKGHGLQLAKLSDYREPIVSRDFFAPYVRPAPPPSKQRGPTVNPADFAFVTGFTEIDGAAQVWIKDRMADKLWTPAIGGSFTIGNLKGTIEAIRPEGEVIVVLGGHRRLLRVGDSLSGGVEIQDKQPKKAEKTGDSAGPGPSEAN